MASTSQMSHNNHTNPTFITAKLNVFFIDLSYYIHHLINGYVSYYKR